MTGPHVSPESALVHLLSEGRTQTQVALLLGTSDRNVRRWMTAETGMMSDRLTDYCQQFGVMLLHEPGDGWSAWFAGGEE